MSKDLSLDDRMKEFYEHRFRVHLPRRIPTILRIDGKAFHSTTRGFEKPWDDRIVNAMKAAALYLCQEIQGCKLAYFQSDEISLLVTDYDDLATEAWFDYNLQKLASVSGSMATLGFNRSILASCGPEKVNKTDFLFDSRAFSMPKEDVVNYFIWRQQDATRNSINGLARKYFSHKELNKKNTSEVQEMLFKQHGINWNNIPTWQKRGFAVKRKDQNWEIDEDIPIFTQDRNYIEQYVFLTSEEEK